MRIGPWARDVGAWRREKDRPEQSSGRLTFFNKAELSGCKISLYIYKIKCYTDNSVNYFVTMERAILADRKGKDTFPAFKLEGIESCALSSCDILLRL